MLGNNIKQIRKEKGYSQETLAEKLHVVRQTVSKWEKGISVPDAEMLNQISELFEAPVSELLSSTITEQEHEHSDNEVAKQLAILNDQLANQSTQRRRNFRRLVIGVICAMLLLIVCYMFCFWRFRVVPRQNAVLSSTEIVCELNGETYRYGVTYDQNFQIREAGGDAWIANHVNVEQYDDANILLAQIEDYFTSRGGTYTVIR